MACVDVNPALLPTLPRSVLRGIGQIFLQRSAGCGLAVLAAMALQAPQLALACALGALVATLAGRRLHEAQALDDGLFGFNGALAGLGVLIVLAPGPLAWALVVAASLLATALLLFLRRRLPVSPYTAPFVLVTWGVMALATVAPLAPATPIVSVDVGWSEVANGILRGIGQVVFLDHPMAGALCLLGLLLAGPRVAVTALIAATAGLALARALGFPDAPAALGLYGYNAVLTVIALLPRIQVKGQRWIVVAAAVLTVLLVRGVQLLGLPALTAPFVLATWLLLRVSRAPADAPASVSTTPSPASD